MVKMKTPKKKEVVKYFENAKEVECLCSGKSYDISKNITRDFYKWHNSFWIDTHIDIKVWDETQGYAKILSYKEPKEKTYKITREQLEKLHRQGNDYTKFDIEYLFPEVFETKLTVGKWYKYPDYEKWNLRITEVDSKAKRVKGYGFGSDGVWMENALNDSWEFKELEKCIEMTDQEVTDALTREAARIGFKEGVYMVDVYNGESGKDTVQVSSNIFQWEPIGAGINAGQMALRDSDGNILFHNGKFVEIIRTLTIQEAEAKLNCKIV